ncbi:MULTISPECIES: DUF5062 family protein [unclassified Oleiphilus]|jgi:hypothetical protein|nr:MULTISPECIES: DUF5062 family protein [unclassified Oleiphilus]KZY42758.1 hypothetical protein A3732_02385 [Oleiphilus sp. HI0050]KZY77659.1 hypothetical protein A3740_09790 [Oleiphilus sp. HI0068]KZY81017.1 hypothetical protein A3741_18045 [Oleiphilus sp. HI0069]KZY89042.1 hypothetical protein A3743_09510 [Oleiphilus sp. HI0072]KZZ10539.1 hypothetical protein A3749_10900 [Oleiphilus sp. HI0078]KZZ21093.1 hypothetical protein A3752_09855 [Oleiphilus sp. HI0081]KZZ42762.1 hypothetical prote
MAKKLKNEAQLLKEAIRIGTLYAEKRGVAKFEADDSQDDKIEYIYRLLVHDKQLQPLAKDDLTLVKMKHKIVMWLYKQLPEGHPLK